MKSYKLSFNIFKYSSIGLLYLYGFVQTLAFTAGHPQSFSMPVIVAILYATALFLTVRHCQTLFMAKKEIPSKIKFLFLLLVVPTLLIVLLSFISIVDHGFKCIDRTFFFCFSAPVLIWAIVFVIFGYRVIKYVIVGNNE